MGVINLTPDSFYKGSRAIDIASVLEEAEKMIQAGADIIDLGGVSTRPGSKAPSPATEKERLLPALKAIRHHFPEILVSIDTYRAEVLSHCIDIGIDLVNDISAGQMDKGFLDVVAASGLPYILMHMKGTPETMQSQPGYDDIMLELLIFFSEKIHSLRSKGIVDIIIDPGIGFGKSIEDNFDLIRRMPSLRIFDCPILLGLSRKSFIYRTLECSAHDALNGTTAMHMLGLQNGADLIRVHDVRQAVECVELWMAYRE